MPAVCHLFVSGQPEFNHLTTIPIHHFIFIYFFSFAFFFVPRLEWIFSVCSVLKPSTLGIMSTFTCAHIIYFGSLVMLCSVELHKANMESRSQGGAGEATNQSAVAAVAASSALANALPLAQLLAKPGALSALGLSGLTALTSLSEILTGAAAQQQAQQSAVQTTGVHRSGRSGGYEPKVRSSTGSSSPPSGNIKKDRNKFAPY
jgi:hypothetical protein